ncbi:hypothetical protein PIB30_014282 [Stylosanthes scabra]|uniref:BZIP domain-containing protein n=1 Tax=Stylosanthes scabra TaxID=79078 RepID=A0ABU6Z452_9FABA|nr:hypothetical protein [Stylosanthes scabra]
MSEEDFQFSCHGEVMLTPSELEELFSLINQPAENFDPASPSSFGSQGSNRAVYSTHERKLRRKQSNRESARRSRWRKKRHLENLTNQLNRLKAENRELKNRLGLTTQHNMLLSFENEHLKFESANLVAKLLDAYRILGTMLSQ